MNSNEVTIWDYLKSQGLNDFAVAGIMGNLYAESGLQPDNLQNNYESILNMNDFQYTQAVDNGTYNNFVYDKAGYGLAQWTFWSRKDGLLRMVKRYTKSIADLNVQLEYLCDELKEFGLWDKLNACNSVKDASNLILFEYEKPYDTGNAVQIARGNWSQQFYDKYHNTNTAVTVPVPDKVEMYGIMALMNLDKESAIKLAHSLQEVGMTVSVFPVEC